MADVKLYDPGSGTVYLVDETEAEAAAAQNGLRVPTDVEEAKYDAEKRSGGLGNEVRTGVEEAARKVAAPAAAVARGVLGDEGAAAGLVSEQTSDALAFSGKDVLPSAFTPQALERRAVNPTAAQLGGAVPQLIGGAAVAALTGGAGIVPLLAGEAATGAVSGAADEALDADLERRGVDPTKLLYNVGLNAAINVGSAGVLSVGAAAARALARQGKNALDFAASALPGAAKYADETLVPRAAKIVEDAASEAPAAVKLANNPGAQRDAIGDLEFRFSKELEGRPLKGTTKAKFAQLAEIAAESQGTPLAEAADRLLQSRALWGDAAIDRLTAARALDAVEASPTREYAEALRAAGKVKAAKALETTLSKIERIRGDKAVHELRSVGAAGAGEPGLSDAGLAHFTDNAPQIREAVLDAAGNTSGRAPGKGVFQDLFDQFKAATNNRTKRLDFAAGAPTNPAIQNAFGNEIAAIADQMTKAAQTFDRFNAGSKASALRGLAEELKAAAPEARGGLLDQSKQLLDRYHLGAISDRTDPTRAAEYLAAIDAPANRARAALENPAFVGQSNADLQAGRNAAWSDKDTGFIANLKRAEAFGPKLFKKIDVDYHTGELITEYDPGAIKQLLGMDHHEAKPVLAAWAKLLDSMELMGQRTIESGASSAAKTPLLGLQKSIDSARQIFSNIDGLIEARRVADVAAMTPASVAAQAAGHAAQAVVHGAAQAVGSLVPGVGNVAAAAVAHPIASRASRAAEEYVTRRAIRTGAQSSFVTARAPSLLKKGAALAAGVSVAGAAGVAGAAEGLQENHDSDVQKTAQALVSGELPYDEDRAPDALGRFQGEHATLEQAYRAFHELLRDPERLIDAYSDAFQGMPPQLAAQMGAQAMKAVGFLQLKAQQPRAVSVAYPHGTPPSPLQVRTFALYATAALDPKSVLADARFGRLRREQVETLKAVWPATYNELKIAVVEQIGNGASTLTRQRMNLLFDFGSSVDPALGPNVSRAVNAARQAAPEASGAAPGTDRARLASTSADMPAGAASLQLGPSLDR